jgi:peptidoglycan hydrolase-like protein with peptidoglycan-binding domain
MERYERGLREAMPYANETLLVGEFRGTSQTQLLWTQSAAMNAWVQLRQQWGQPIYLPYAFRRIGEGGHANQSQHYAGTAFDCAQNIGNEGRARLRSLAASSGLFTYVEPAYLTPTWVHLDTRTLPPACSTGGYPLLRRGNQGVYVCILQDALNIAVGAGLLIDGVFGLLTEDALRFCQATNRLTADGIVGCATWRLLTDIAVGAGLRAE